MILNHPYFLMYQDLFVKQYFNLFTPYRKVDVSDLTAPNKRFFNFTLGTKGVVKSGIVAS